MMTERGARYEIAIDGTTRTYLDREDIAQQAAARLKQINPNSKNYFTRPADRHRDRGQASVESG